ncbi:MerR family transcriptional regulator [Streptomyces sp. SL13]|uniref:MerR family transcriptional regulator n=1 Tax=Streptantibioticus silvisoli TaxID=2705255 RepID=A0AA90GZX0_9ACTN|nr:MerR family transcriptional regulator [Streptantibioticus silvisoli]MDI5967757.1 MerR family transcriptional regulator [Streptantibioticus silvisoli]
MRSTLAIGDFSRATHLSVKTLRHYHRVGLLEPADVDPRTGYRRYTTDQIPAAQVIRRFRDLDMPLDDIRAVLTAPDPGLRNDLIAGHLTRLEASLARTQQAAATLRDLLCDPAPPGPRITTRGVPAVAAAAISEVIDVRDAEAWFEGALGELYATIEAQGLRVTGPSGGDYATELFADERGPATLFVPCDGTLRPAGRVVAHTVPAREFAVTVHHGPHSDVDLAYGALATYVTRHELAVDGPLRENYLVSSHETPDPSAWRTEIGWPVFRTGPGD